MKKKITLSILIICSIIHFGQAQCNSETVAHYNMGDFPFTSTSNVVVTMSGTNSGTLGPYSAYGCSTATAEANTIRLDPGNGLILGFSQTVYEISLVMGVMNTYENGTITTNNGLPTLSSNCATTDLAITGNAFEQIGALASPVIKITIPNGATSITINCLSSTQGGGNGVFTVDVLDCISTTPILGINDFIELNSNNLSIYPNPSTDFIQISGLTKADDYKIYNVIGAEVNNGIISDNEKINIQYLTNGLYFLKFKEGNTIKFLKE
jgi:hypothetical protein